MIFDKNIKKRHQYSWNYLDAFEKYEQYFIWKNLFNTIAFNLWIQWYANSHKSTC